MKIWTTEKAFCYWNPGQAWDTRSKIASDATAMTIQNLQQILFFKTRVSTGGDDDVVEDFYTEQAAGVNQTFGNG